jgi:hypothetical protein
VVRPLFSKKLDVYAASISSSRQKNRLCIFRIQIKRGASPIVLRGASPIVLRIQIKRGASPIVLAIYVQINVVRPLFTRAIYARAALAIYVQINVVRPLFTRINVVRPLFTRPYLRVNCSNS